MYPPASPKSAAAKTASLARVLLFHQPALIARVSFFAVSIAVAKMIP